MPRRTVLALDFVDHVLYQARHRGIDFDGEEGTEWDTAAQLPSRLRGR